MWCISERLSHRGGSFDTSSVGKRLIGRSAGNYVAAVTLVLSCFASGPTFATNRYASGTGSDTSDCRAQANPCRSIGKAYAEAANGDVIWVEAGIYFEKLLFAKKNITLVGSGPSVTAIDGQQSGRPVTVGAGAQVTIEGFAIRNGSFSWSTGAEGGGVYVEDGSALTLKNCFVHGNTIESTSPLLLDQGAKGGGIYSAGHLTLQSTLVSGNRAKGLFALGGGVAFESSSAQLQIVRSTISGNRAEITAPGAARGGGVYVSATGATAATIGRSTIISNSADPSPVHNGAGGGIFAARDTKLVIGSSTIVSNQASGSGGGIFSDVDNDAAYVKIKATVIALNQTADASSPNCRGSRISSQGYTFVESVTGCTIGRESNPPTDVLGTPDVPIDPKLGQFGYNGGPTPTVMPLPASPLIDVAGLQKCDGPDQRDVAAPFGDSCDIGAVEADVVTMRPQYAQPEIDLFRITQGLDIDLTDGSYYALIAGKHSLVRLQLYAESRERLIESAVCRVQRVALLLPLIRIPDLGPLVTIQGSYDQFNRPINRQPYGFFGGSNVVDCWVGAQDVAVEGDYSIQAEIKMFGVAQPRVFDLGIKTFYPSNNVRLLLYPYVMPPKHPEFVPWDFNQRAAIEEALREMNRRYPLRSGTGKIDETGVMGKEAPGLRFDLGPVTNCPAAAGTELADFEKAQSDCDASVRVAAKTELQRRNALLDRFDTAMAADRIDTSGVLALVPDTHGGQAQNWNAGRDCSAGSAVESTNRGESASVVGQEVGHCLGLVPPQSPHFTPSHHSTTWTIPIARGAELIDFARNQDAPGAVALMNGFTAAEGNTFMEGFEWNWFGPFTHGYIGGGSGLIRSGRESPKEGLLEVSGSIGSDGQVRNLYMRKSHDFAYTETGSAASSPLHVLFLGMQKAVLKDLPAMVAFDHTHHETNSRHYETNGRESNQFPFFVATDIPPGTRSIVLAYEHAKLFEAPASAARPAIRKVSIERMDKRTLRVLWKTGEREPAAFYRVFFKPGTATAPILIATGVTGNSLTVSADGLPASSQGVFVVEASNGYGSSSATTPSVEFEARPPIAGISEPTSKGRYLSTSPILLSGFAHAVDGKPLESGAVTWTSDRSGHLGSGLNLRVSLPVGHHRITLRTAAAAAPTTEDSVEVDVNADVDKDGIADEDELKHACLLVGHNDMDGDPDGDGLTSRLEVRQGSDPCIADTDRDGVSDGEEIKAGSNPLDRNSLPLPSRISVADQVVNLGTCGRDLREQSRPVLTDTGLVWQVRTDSDWLLVERQNPPDERLVIKARCEGLAAGNYSGRVMLGAPGSAPTELLVRLNVGG